MPEWTDTERDLLRELRRHVGHCIAAPEDAIYGFKDGHESGGGHGFEYEFGRAAITGRWHEWHLVARTVSGRPGKWHKGRLLREARISYAQLHRWCAGQPADVREQAVINWRVHPVETRNLPALERVALAAIDADAPAPAPAATELALFELAEVIRG
jgi:hypothetical protein